MNDWDDLNDDDPIQFGRERVAAATAEMDMTPMVDVTFLLLIFFMVTAAFTMQKSFEVPVPRQDSPSTNSQTVEDFEQDSDFVVVRVDEFNTFYVSVASWNDEQEARSAHDLLVKLRKATSAPAGGARKLLVMAHGDAAHEKVVAAMDAGNEVGMEEVKLVTIEDSVF